MAHVSRFATAGMLMLMVSASAAAQDVPIVGTWRWISMGPPRQMTTVTYGPNGDTFTEIAIAPQPGQGGGVLRTAGQYELEGPSTVRVTFGQSEMCAAGVPCGPAPPQLVPSPGTSSTFSFSFRGDNQIVGPDGRMWLRIR